MYSRILIATDGSDLAGQAVEHGLGLAKAVGAAVVFVTVTEMWPALEIAADVEAGKSDAIQSYEAAAAKSAEAILETAKARADTLGVSATTKHVVDRRPAEGIMDAAEREDCDLIVMASHGRRGLQKVLIGSQAAEVITLTNRPVLVVR